MTPNQLPPLPKPFVPGDEHNPRDYFVADQMHAYALAALAQQAQEPVEWKPIDADTVPEKPNRLFWLLVDGSPILGYYHETPLREMRDADGCYIDQQDADAYWGNYADGEPVEPTNYCELKPPSTTPQPQPAPQVPAPVDERESGLPLAQEPKYTTNGTHIINRHSGEQVPHDEPVFVFRARDAVALHALCAYFDRIQDREPFGPHAYAVAQRIDDFKAFAAQHPDRVKWPDTAALQSPAPQSTKGGEA